MDLAAFLKHHNLERSMSRRGNCHDNAVAESFFNLLKRERIRRKIYRTREEATQDVFNYIEMFYPEIKNRTTCANGFVGRCVGRSVANPESSCLISQCVRSKTHLRPWAPSLFNGLRPSASAIS